MIETSKIVVSGTSEKPQNPKHNLSYAMNNLTLAATSSSSSNITIPYDASIWNKWWQAVTKTIGSAAAVGMVVFIAVTAYMRIQACIKTLVLGVYSVKKIVVFAAFLLLIMPFPAYAAVGSDAYADIADGFSIEHLVPADSGMSGAILGRNYYYRLHQSNIYRTSKDLWKFVA